jgi:RimJ/RimL family protein N-acetyltransferase
MLTLRSIDYEEGRKFFKLHPHLRDMWRRYYGIPLAEWFLRWKAEGHLSRWGNKMEKEEPSEVFVVEQDGKSIGFTGYFRTQPCPPDMLRLRWTAVMESAQGHHYAAEALKLLCDRIHQKYPEIEWLSESCPESMKSLRRWFRQNGFEEWDDPDKNGTGIPFVRTVSLRRRV